MLREDSPSLPNKAKAGRRRVGKFGASFGSQRQEKHIEEAITSATLRLLAFDGWQRYMAQFASCPRGSRKPASEDADPRCKERQACGNGPGGPQNTVCLIRVRRLQLDDGVIDE